MKLQMHVAKDELARMVERRGVYRGLVGKHEGKGPHDKRRRG